MTKNQTIDLTAFYDAHLPNEAFVPLGWRTVTPVLKQLVKPETLNIMTKFQYNFLTIVNDMPDVYQCRLCKKFKSINPAKAGQSRYVRTVEGESVGPGKLTAYFF